MFGADLFLMPFMEFQVRTVTKLAGIKKYGNGILSVFISDVSLLSLDMGGPYKC